MSAPAGWPRDLVPPAADDFAERGVGWLLDRAPAQMRTSVLRSHPAALAYVVEHHARARVDATREAYRRIRADLGPALGPEALAAAQQALELQGAELTAELREVTLVREALERLG